MSGQDNTSRNDAGKRSLNDFLEPLKKIAVPANVNAVVFHPDGKSVVAGLADNSIRILSVDGKELKNLAGHKGPVAAVVFAPKGDTFISAGADKGVGRLFFSSRTLQVLILLDGSM